MSKSRLEWKVGLFVFISLALLAALLIEFSKGLALFQSAYEIDLESRNAGGLKPRADVLMAGVRVGTVSGIELAPDGKTVTIRLRILSQFDIRTNAVFLLDTSGFLGDQYVAIAPTTIEGPIFSKTVPGRALAEPPFNLQEFTRTATGFISRIDETVKKLNDALMNVTRVVLNPETLTNMSFTIAHLREFSDDALKAVNNLNALVATNAPSLRTSSSNLASFSVRLNDFADGLNGVLATNSPDLHVAVKNLESSSETLKNLLSEVQAGKGLAGNVLKNEQLSANVSEIASNLSITSSNLNRLGLWGILWQHKPASTNLPARQPLATPKNPFE